MPVSVLTRSFDQYRTGMNYGETRLTPALLREQGIRKLFDVPLPGDLRGTEGMPLVVPGLPMGDGLVHDVLFVASMGNDVRAVDATAPNAETGQGQVLWQRRVGNPVKSSRTLDMFAIADNWGILSTPVIDPATGTLYVVSMSERAGAAVPATFAMHALNLYDGSERVPPLVLDKASYAPPGGLPQCVLGSVMRKQRCALAFSPAGGGTVLVANGSFDEDAATNQGWVIACDVSQVGEQRAMEIAASWVTTARYSGGGLWMGGQGPALDDAGFVYVTSGNGAFDGVTDFGESMLKLEYVPRTAAAPASIAPVGWFTPFTDTGREGADSTLPSDSLIPQDGRDDEPSGTSNMDSPSDQDLNSGGTGVIPRSLSGFTCTLCHVAGKDGIWYLVNADKMPRSKLADFAPDRIAANYALLALPPVAVTYFPGGMDLAPTDTARLQTTYGGKTHHMHGTPVVYKSPAYPGSLLLYFGGENGPVKAYQLTERAPGEFTLQWLADGAELASAQVPNPGGMPGTMITGSCNGQVPDTGIIWCLMPYGDANKTVTNGRFIAYAADRFENGALIKLWDSEAVAITYMHCKFNLPVAVNGKVYVPTYDSRVMVFG